MVYHWHKNGVPILGADSSSYTTPLLKKADNGANAGLVAVPGGERIQRGSDFDGDGRHYAADDYASLQAVIRSTRSPFGGRAGRAPVAKRGELRLPG